MSEVKKIRYSYDQIHELVKTMAQKITETGNKIDFSIDGGQRKEQLKLL